MLALLNEVEAEADVVAAAALGVGDIRLSAALPMPPSKRTAPTADACPPPGSREGTLMRWIARQQEAGVGWAKITRAVVNVGHDTTEAALRRRCWRRQRERGRPW